MHDLDLLQVLACRLLRAIIDYDTDVRLGMNTTAGSFILYHAAGDVVNDAFVVKKLCDTEPSSSLKAMSW